MTGIDDLGVDDATSNGGNVDRGLFSIDLSVNSDEGAFIFRDLFFSDSCLKFFVDFICVFKTDARGKYDRFFSFLRFGKGLGKTVLWLILFSVLTVTCDKCENNLITT